MGRPARRAAEDSRENLGRAGGGPPAAAGPAAEGGAGRSFAIVPAFNEGSMIGSVVRMLAPVVGRVVVIDDGSRDDTARRAREAGAAVVEHAVNRGQGAALQTGIDYCLRHGAEVLVTFDADGQHSASDVPRLLEAVTGGGYDVALGSRFLGAADSVPPLRRILLRAAVVWTRITSHLAVTDTHNGLRAFTRHAASTIHLKLDRMAHASELLDQLGRSGLRCVEIPVSVRYTAYSRGKGQGAAAALRILFDHLIGRLLG